MPRLAILRRLSELTANVSAYRYVADRPTAVPEPMADFLILRLPQAMRQPGDTYSLTTGQVVLFARDLYGGLENTSRLEEMLRATTELFPIRDSLFLATRPVLLPGGTDGAGFHSVIIQFGIRVHRGFELHPKESFSF